MFIYFALRLLLRVNFIRQVSTSIMFKINDGLFLLNSLFCDDKYEYVSIRYDIYVPII